MNLSERAEKIYKILLAEYHDTKSPLNHRSPFEMLVATVLSAQCTDARVNKITPDLFAKFDTPDDMANASVTEIEDLIKSAGLYKTKAKNLKATAEMLRNQYDSKVPQNIDDLIKLPGIGRKSANVILNHAFDIQSGIAVDTHVKRVSGRIGLTQHTDPLKIEKDLMELFSKDEWSDISILIIRHGRRICTARKPRCERCVISELCDYGRNALEDKAALSAIKTVKRHSINNINTKYISK